MVTWRIPRLGVELFDGSRRSSALRPAVAIDHDNRHLPGFPKTPGYVNHVPYLCVEEGKEWLEISPTMLLADEPPTPEIRRLSERPGKAETRSTPEDLSHSCRINERRANLEGRQRRDSGVLSRITSSAQKRSFQVRDRNQR